jgi:peroxiredoxin
VHARKLWGSTFVISQASKWKKKNKKKRHNVKKLNDMDGKFTKFMLMS